MVSIMWNGNRNLYQIVCDDLVSLWPRLGGLFAHVKPLLCSSRAPNYWPHHKDHIMCCEKWPCPGVCMSSFAHFCLVPHWRHPHVVSLNGRPSTACWERKVQQNPFLDLSNEALAKWQYSRRTTDEHQAAGRPEMTLFSRTRRHIHIAGQ